MFTPPPALYFINSNMHYLLYFFILNYQSKRKIIFTVLQQSALYKQKGVSEVNTQY